MSISNLIKSSLVILVLLPASVFATHNRAGEIIYRLVAPFTYEIEIITYSKASSVAADRDSLEIFWGDGASEFLYRTNGVDTDKNKL